MAKVPRRLDNLTSSLCFTVFSVLLRGGSTSLNSSQGDGERRNGSGSRMTLREYRGARESRAGAVILMHHHQRSDELDLGVKRWINQPYRKSKRALADCQSPNNAG